MITGCATPSSAAAVVPEADGVRVVAPGVVVVDGALAAPVIAGLSRAIATTRLIGESQLTGGFVTTRGFGIACHVEAVDDAVARAPFLRPFVDVALDPGLRGLARPSSFLERVGAILFDDVTALYLNVLQVPPGGAVERHVDATLGVAPDDDRAIVPRVVVALYVDVPVDLQGGELCLFRGDQPVATVSPRPGRLVCFDGRLAHEVKATTATSARVSCVAELYRLPRRRLRALPRLRVQANGFKDVLERGRRADDQRAIDQTTATPTASSDAAAKPTPM
jgi:hypothetical protein